MASPWTKTPETFICQYLSGDPDVPFESVFIAFRDLLAVSSPHQQLRHAGTATPIFSDGKPAAPNSVSVVSRTIDISEYRRQGMVHVLWKLVSIGFCTNRRELEKLWKAKGPKELEDGRFLGVAIWAGQTETEIDEKSHRDLSQYQSLTLNLVMGLLRQKDWRGKTLPPSHVINSATQTNDSFLQQRQRDTDEILKHNKPQHLTKRALAVLREQNQALEQKARRRHRLELRHSFTQTTNTLTDGFKSMESDSSASFSWLDLAPNPVRFFPMLWAATQTDDKEFSATKEKVKFGKLKELISLLGHPPNRGQKNVLKPVLERYIFMRHEVTSLCAIGKPPSNETLLGHRVGHFVHLLLELVPNLEPGRCPHHQTGPATTGCQFCEAAIKAPPPWADGMLRLHWELFSESYISNEIDYMHYLNLHRRGLEPEDLFRRLLPQWSLLLHLIRQHLLDTIGGETAGRKELRAQILDCGCFVPKTLWAMANYKNLDTILPQDMAALHPAHQCLRCGQLESESLGKFLVCSECRRRRLLVKAHYCSLDCLLKDWDAHRNLHDAFAPGKIHRFGREMMLFS